MNIDILIAATSAFILSMILTSIIVKKRMKKQFTEYQSLEQAIDASNVKLSDQKEKLATIEKMIKDAEKKLKDANKNLDEMNIETRNSKIACLFRSN